MLTLRPLFGLKKRQFLLLITLGMVCSVGSAQLNIESATNGFSTPEQLIRDVFQGEGVSILDIVYEGKNEAVGLFSNAGNYLPIDQGLVLTTGSAELAELQNNTENLGTLWNDQTPDADLTAIASDPIEDVARYEITFIPSSDRITFRYLMASEEYPEFACTDFNDVFGFFLTGPNPNGPAYQAENIAFVPDPADPTGLTFTTIPVSINSINENGIDPTMGCEYDFVQYYNKVNTGDFPTYDAYLDVFFATAKVVPCETYTIKIAVADVSDDEYDTAIFLEGNSFSAVAASFNFANNPLTNVITEGCDQTALEIILPFPLLNDTTINFAIIGTATAGDDFININTSITIPAGQTEAIIPITTLADGIAEGRETLGFLLNACSTDTLWLTIQDQDDFDPGFPEILSRCDGPLQIMPHNDLSMDDEVFVNEAVGSIPFVGNQEIGGLPLISAIEVSGMEDYHLTDGIIQSVCLNISHQFAAHLDIYLRSPHGKILELSTKNGAGGADYTATCFTPDATDLVSNSPAPMTGFFQPESPFSTIYEMGKDVEGRWEIIIKDITDDGINGNLLDWSITFNTAFIPSYVWSPDTGLSCSNCPDPIANPAVTTDYTVSFMDPFGCEVTKEVRFERELPTLPVVTQEIDCPGNMNGFITAQIDGEGVPPFSFDWGVLGTDSIVGPVGMGNYEVTISDSNGCTASQLIALVDPDSIQVTFEVIEPCAEDDASGQLTAVVMGGNPMYTYQWGNNANNVTTEIVNNLAVGTYQLTVMDENGCTRVASTILEAGTLSATSLFQPPSCFEENNGWIEVMVIGGTAPYQFALNGQSIGSNPLLTGLGAGIYTVDILDANDCVWQLTGIELETPEPISLDLGPDLLIYLGERPILDIDIENAQGELQDLIWNWDAVNLPFLSCTTCDNPSIQNLLFPHTFELTLIDSANCIATDQVIINIDKPRQFFVPTGFTPNADQLNDVLLTHGDRRAMVLSWQIYDRWGNQVFSADNFKVGDPEINWDGNYKNQALDPAVFVWVAQVEFIDGFRDIFKGESTLIR